MKKIPRIRPTMSTQEAALELRVSETTVKRLVRRGTLHTTKPKKSRGHWASFVIVDKAFREEQHRRMHGLKAPRRKHIPNPSSRQLVTAKPCVDGSANSAAADNLNLNPAIDPSPIQTVTPPAETQPAFLVSARGYIDTWYLPQPTLYIRHNTATFDFDGEAERLDGLVARAEACADYVMASGAEHEETITRCTAILAAACILQLILAAYYTLCHFNII